MASAGVDIERVKQVLRDATSPEGPFTQRGLSKAAGLDRDAVYDILNDRNQNPTIGSLASLAEAMGKDLAVFGLSARPVRTTVAELQRAIAEALPHLPSRDNDTRARYLAEVVADVLELQPDRGSA